MSRANLYVLFSDGIVRYGLYNGSTDMPVCAPLYDRPQDAWDAYDLTCADGSREGEPVRIATDYGGGGSWNGTATRDRVTGDPRGEEDGYEQGEPGWATYPVQQ